MKTLSFNLELSEPNGSPLALGSGPARTIITADKGTVSIGTVSGKIYPITVRNIPQAAGAITLTVKKTRLRRHHDRTDNRSSVGEPRVSD